MKSDVLNILQSKIDAGVILEKPKERSFGHFATPIAFSLAKKLKKSPIIIAEELVTLLKDEEAFKEISAVKGYINLTLSHAFLDEYASWALQHASEFGKGKCTGSILLEFVSANPTGPLHIGHARGAVYGDTLLRLGRHLGYEMTAEYYVNDAGNQIDLLGLSLQLEAQSSCFDESVDYPESFYRGEYLTDLAQEAVNFFDKNDFYDERKQRELALWAKDKILALIVDDLAAANIHFDTFVSEASLYAQWDSVMQKMHDGLYEKEGKIWLRSSDKGDEKDRVVVREDKRPTYLAGDIIYHNQKFERGFEHYINIWGADHHGYIARVKAAIDFCGFDAEKLEVLLSQMVSLLKNGEPYKMSKRAGNVILMRDIVEEIGSDALRYIFASKKSDTALEFDVESFKQQDSSNPIYYIQYAHARIQTLLKKSQFDVAEIMAVPLNDLHQDADILLFESLLLPEVISDAFHSRQLQKLPDYLKSLAALLHKYYYDHKIIDTENEKIQLKLLLVVALSIKTGLGLLGIEAKDRM